jgi:hypothetical protein
MNKILSQMMIYCREHISDNQVEELQKFKDNSQDFDWTQPDYKTLLNFDINRYKVNENLPKEKQAHYNRSRNSLIFIKRL